MRASSPADSPTKEIGTMAWLIGIDEAGYGPNLGPFVMTSVACRVPEPILQRDLWQTLRKAVRRHPSDKDGRLLIDDSKLVYSSARGLLELEISVLAALWPPEVGQERCLAHYIDWASPAARIGLGREPWYLGTSKLPVVAEAPFLGLAATRFQDACAKNKICWGPVCSVVFCPEQFNGLLDRWGSKGAALAQALAELLVCNWRLGGNDEKIIFVIDKHGGRNYYSALLQNAVPNGFIVALQEGMDRSVYRILGLEREVELTIQPRADAANFCVALASMASKYLREVLMQEFNRFWQSQVPGLKPTAGYPGDSTRFFQAIRPAAQQLGIPETALWRRK